MNGNKVFKSFIQGKLHEAEDHLVENLNQLAAMIIDGQKKILATGIVSEASTDPMEHANKAVKPVKIRGYDKNHKKKEMKFESIEAFEEWADSELAEEFDIHEILEDVEQIDEAGFSAPLSPLQKTNKTDSGYMKNGKSYVFNSSNPDMRINRRAGLDKKIHWDDEAHKGVDQQKNQLNRIKRRLASKKLAKEEQVEEGIAQKASDVAQKASDVAQMTGHSVRKIADGFRAVGDTIKDKVKYSMERRKNNKEWMNKQKLAKEDEIDPSLKLSDKREVMEGSEATRKILLAKVRAGFGKAEKSEREPIKRYPDEYYKNMEKRAMEKRAKNEDVEQIDELDHQQGILDNYVGKVRRMKDGGEKLSKKRQDGYNLALKKKWGDKKYGLPEPKVKAVNR